MLLLLVVVVLFVGIVGRYEKDHFDLEEADEMDDHLGDLLPTAWDLEDYTDAEQTIVRAMDFCLHVFP